MISSFKLTVISVFKGGCKQLYFAFEQKQANNLFLVFMLS